ncbi:MAG: phytoene/squalene synthase family protein [Dehalococcoidia bacterium]|nr:phytoene/squalene synthase family protein [Dehalococcoidia bacterium]
MAVDQRTRETGPVPLEEALAWCRDYTRERAKNFYYAFAILPGPKRHAIYAAYAFSGLVDDIADELSDRDEQVRRLGEARERMHAAARGEAEGPLFTALAWAFREFDVPEDFFEELVNGVEMDFTVDRYATWQDLYQYCYRVASMVGLICTAIFGTRAHPRGRQYAIDMGIGLQIVNIMRDVREDAARGRVYFPQDELARFGLSDADILGGCCDERFVQLMQLQRKRARQHLARGKRLLPLLDLRSRMCVNVLQGTYAEILRRIEKRRYDVLSERVALSTPAKLLTIARLWGEAALVRAR